MSNDNYNGFFYKKNVNRACYRKMQWHIHTNMSNLIKGVI